MSLSDLRQTSEPPIGIVLAGGNSSRMGQDKALLNWQGESLVARGSRILAEACGVVAVADRCRGYQADRLSLPDGPGRGPVAGLLGAASAFPGRSLIAVACDMPQVPSTLLAWLASIPAQEVDFCLPSWERGREPLCALFRPPTLALMERRAFAGTYNLTSLADTNQLRVSFLESDSLSAFGQPESMFANLNDPRDLAHLERYRSRS